MNVVDALTPTNFRSGRALPIDLVIMHVMEGSEIASRNWFRHPEAQASAHYGIDLSGAVFRYVSEDDTAWHAGNPEYNARSIAVELEGHSANQANFTDAMMRSAVELVGDVLRRRGIPLDRAHVIGHAEVPDPRRPGMFGGSHNHTDPGPHFPWEAFVAALGGVPLV